MTKFKNIKKASRYPNRCREAFSLALWHREAFDVMGQLFINEHPVILLAKKNKADKCTQVSRLKFVCN